MRSDPPTKSRCLPEQSESRKPPTRFPGLSFDVPPHVARHLITTSNPAEIYILAHAEKDRKLRLLIRRYVNQIQYGCQNVYCKTPTCLSFRKRQTDGAVRTYTDISARTLALSLVEDGRDPEAALCQNDPVVPWYDEPSGRRPRSPTEKNRLSKGKGPMTGGHIPEMSNGHVKSPLDSRQSRLRHPQPKASHPIPMQNTEKRGSSTEQKKELDRPAAPQQEETVEVPKEETSPMKKDVRSFTQALFDTFPLFMLQWLPGSRRIRSEGPSDLTASDSSLPNNAPGKINSDVGDSADLIAEAEYQHRNAQNGDHLVDESHPLIDLPDEAPVESLPSDGVSKVLNDSKSQHDSSPQSSGPSSWETVEDKAVASIKISQDREALSLQCSEELSEDDSSKPLTSITEVLTFQCFTPEVLDWLCLTLQNLQYSEMPDHLKDSLSCQIRDLTRQSTFYCLSGRFRILENDSTSALSQFGPDEPPCWPLLDWVTHLLALSSFQQYSEIMACLTSALRFAHTPPPKSRHRRQNLQRIKALSTSLRCNDEGQSTDERQVHVTDKEVAQMCVAGLCALANLMFLPLGPVEGRLFRMPESQRRKEFFQLRNQGLVYPDASIEWTKRRLISKSARDVPTYLDLVDVFDDPHAVRLMDNIIYAINTRLAFSNMAALQHGKRLVNGKNKKKAESITDLIIDSLRTTKYSHPNVVTLGLLEWLRNVLLKEWDGQPIVRRAGVVGGAVLILASLFQSHADVHLRPEDFHFTFIANKLDALNMPMEWLSYTPDNEEIHLLSYSFLFETKTLVAYFRSINYATMSRSVEDALIVWRHSRQFGDGRLFPMHGTKEMWNVLRPHMASFFVLTIRRDNVLTDAINQVWRRQKRELMRPLKVRLGSDEGEEGLDAGGVQQEFFRVAFGQAIDPDYGMFMVDDRTSMTWFHPGSLEPLYKFEVLGVLMSLAVYNAVTLPITFPLAFYRKLLGLKVKKLAHVADGWPDLSNGLQEMLDWSDGDVADVFMRTYEFSYEAFGTHVNIDMHNFSRHDPWPPLERKKGKERATKTTSFEFPPSPLSTPTDECSPDRKIHTQPDFPTTSASIPGTSTPYSLPSSPPPLSLADAPLVTNATRNEFVSDYIFWLVHKSISAQYAAFEKGFFTCISRTAISIFTPEALKIVIEGSHEIDIEKLKATTTYDDYHEGSATIQDFWSIVTQDWGAEQHKALLEFVTASARVPVAGYGRGAETTIDGVGVHGGAGGLQFVIQRNGVGDDRLPSSMTCFGRLLLPQYSSRQILREKLEKAIGEGKGFGVM